MSVRIRIANLEEDKHLLIKRNINTDLKSNN